MGHCVRLSLYLYNRVKEGEITKVIPNYQQYNEADRKKRSKKLQSQIVDCVG